MHQTPADEMRRRPTSPLSLANHYAGTKSETEKW
jgi:hypothetical protein